MATTAVSRLRHIIVTTLLVAVSMAMGFTLFRIWEVKQEVDEFSTKLNLDYGPQTTLIYDSKDRVISSLYKEHRIPVMLEQMSDPLIKAVISTEDKRFYEHNGVDVKRIAAAWVANLRRGRIVQGASTITQQFVRAAVLDDHAKTYGRKFREAWLSHRLEEKYGKNAILQAYLNHVYFGEGYYGVEAASLGYFGKHASDINAAEGATLASMINKPSGWGVRKDPTRIRERRDWVLREMYQNGFLDAGTFGSSVAMPVASTLATDHLRAEMDPADATVGPYFAQMVHEFLFQQFGVDRALTGGLRVYTTLDSDVQRFAEQSVAKRLAELDKKTPAAAKAKADGLGQTLQAALVAIDPATGYVRAMVGGRDFSASPFNRATDAKRQPGSAFKPFVFAAALEAGFSPGTTIDALDQYIPSAQGAYLPGGEHEEASMTLRSALVHSSNRAAVHLLQLVGLGPTIDLANRVGLQDMPAVPSLALGTGEVSLLNLTSAYTAFANSGVLQSPVFVTRIEDAEGRVIYRGESVGKRVLSESTAYLMASMLADVVDHGTGYTARQSGFGLPAGGKTGTTGDYADAWFVGFTPHLAAGVWVGYDRPQEIMNRGFAAVVAVPAWAGFMKAATTGEKPDWLQVPAGVEHIRRCKESGGLANEYCELAGEAVDDYVSIGREPEVCTHHGYSIVAPEIAPSSSVSSISYPIRPPQ